MARNSRNLFARHNIPAISGLRCHSKSSILWLIDKLQADLPRSMLCLVGVKNEATNLNS